jgi:hypothetical protein
VIWRWHSRQPGGGVGAVGGGGVGGEDQSTKATRGATMTPAGGGKHHA